MSVAVCKSLSPAPFHYDKRPTGQICSDQQLTNGTSDDDHRSGQTDIWNLIQSQKPAANTDHSQKPYIHPLVRRSSSLLSQKSLQICTENIGSETGSDGFSDHTTTDADISDELKNQSFGGKVDVQVANKPTPLRSFPPPIPSIARYQGKPLLQMRTHRHDGRLVVEAVPIPSATVLRAQRHGGRLLLSFSDADTTKQEQEQEQQVLEEKEKDPEMDVEVEEEEEVEVVDRGTMVEVKVSTQPQVQNGSGVVAKKVLRSAFVINKFVGSAPLISGDIDEHSTEMLPRRAVAGSTTTAAAAVVAASALSATSPNDAGDGENKLLVTAKWRRSKEELLHHMQGCGQLRGPLFIWEPWCIATSS